MAAEFKNKFHAETVKRMQDARLQCDAMGDQPLTINWTKDKLLFNPREDPRYELIENFTNKGLSAELIIHGTDRRDSALFTCTASNAYGVDEYNIQLIMQGKREDGRVAFGSIINLELLHVCVEPPDPPQEVKVVEFDGRSAKLAFQPPYHGNSPILQYTIHYQTTSGKRQILKHLSKAHFV